MASITSKMNTLQKANASALSKAATIMSARRSRPALVKPVKQKYDSFKSTAANDMLKKLVSRVQASLQQTIQNLTMTVVGGQGTSAFSFFQGSSSLQINSIGFIGGTTSQEFINEGVENAGGMEALQHWLVDGKTALNIRGFTMEAQVAEGQSAVPAQTGEDAASQAEAAIARFGFTKDDLNRPTEELRTELKKAAIRIKTEQRELGYNNSSAIDYALDDAFQKLAVHESFVQGNGNPEADAQQQQQTNAEQANSIKQQLNLGSGNWGIDSIAQDLAVFGMDFTSLNGDPKELVKSIKDKSQKMIAEMDANGYGTDSALIKARNTITGAASRLVNGIEAGAVISRASSSASASVAVNAFTGKTLNTATVTVGGVNIDANFIIGMGNVVVDPLVLDLNGDGIDLSAAEDGVDFDMEGTGQKDKMGFIRGDDAFLFVDTHGDGVVHDGRQLFGNSGGYENGFDMLAQHDDNGDGVIDENDAIYDKLMVWQEKTEDGVCDSEETMTLREAGISSINLAYQNVREDDGKGNLTGQTGSFTRTDGSEGYTADVWLRRTQGKL